MTRAKSLIKWVLNLGILLYMVFLILLFLSRGAGYDFQIGFLRVQLRRPGNPLMILAVLTLLRILLEMEKKNAVLFVFSLLFSLSLVEMGLRVLDLPIANQPTLNKWKRPSPSLGWELIPFSKGKGHEGAYVEINSHGLRDVERSWEKPEGQYRILCVGDSFTYGVGVDLKDTYPKQIENLLNSTGHSADVINSGVPGYDLYQVLTYLQSVGTRYDPDAVLYFFYCNDLAGLKSADEVKTYYDALVNSEEDRESVYDFSGSYLINFTRNAYTFLWAKFRFLYDADWIRSLHKRKKVFSREWIKVLVGDFDVEFLRKSLARMKDFTDEHGVRFMVVFVPDAVQLHNPSWQEINRIVGQLCRSQGTPFVDVTPTFEEQPDAAALYLFPMDAHTSPRGNALLAGRVRDAIRDLGWLSNP